MFSPPPEELANEELDKELLSVETLLQQCQGELDVAQSTNDKYQAALQAIEKEQAEFAAETLRLDQQIKEAEERTLHATSTMSVLLCANYRVEAMSDAEADAEADEQQAQLELEESNGVDEERRLLRAFDAEVSVPLERLMQWTGLLGPWWTSECRPAIVAAVQRGDTDFSMPAMPSPGEL